MTMIPAFGPWTEHPADADEEKRLASAQQSKTSPLSVDKEHETGVFYGSGKEPYQTSLASCTCNDFVKRKKPCKHIFRLAMELGIIDAAYKTGRSTGERNEAQISFADSVALVEQLSDAAQNAIKDMLYYTSERIDDRQKPVTCHDLDLVPELRTSPLLHENPYPLEEVLNDLPKPLVVQLLDLVHREGKPKRNAAKIVMAAWLAQNAPMLAKEMPPCASFSFVEVFDKAQRDVYKYLHRKYDMETDWYSGVQYPAGSGLLNENELVFYFPDDRITAALTKRGFNRCLNGYIPTKSNR